MEVQLLFRLLSIVLGCTIGFFSFRVYQGTQGSTRGWSYIAIGGFMLCLWAIVQTIVQLLFNAPNIKILSGLLFGVIAIVLPLGFVSLCRAFKINLPDMLSNRNLLIIFGLYWIIMLGINLMLPFDNLLMEISGIAHLALTFMFIIGAIYPSYKLWQTSGNWIWFLLLLFVVIVAISIIPGAYTSGCCNGNFAEEPVCSSVKLDYAEVVPLPCNASILAFSQYYHIPLLVGIIFSLVAFYGLWKKLA
ncbi:MAG: hypothetical protein R6V53_05895 [Candidatus Woesearchaeota archaeon]